MKAIQIRAIPKAHPHIRARDWLSPLVCRLHSDDKYTDGTRTMRFSVRPKKGTFAEEPCAFEWAGMQQDYEQVRRTYQAPVITEFATLALACSGVEMFAGMQITEVTRRGERVDYWLGDQEMLLEVSGQQNGSLATLHKAKARQLKENPFAKDGYVCVANYGAGTARFWYQSCET